MAKPAPIRQRIAVAYQNGATTYHALMHAVFPREQFPHAMRCPTKGGPPGCAFAFGRALRQMGASESWEGRRITIRRDVIKAWLPSVDEVKG